MQDVFIQSNKTFHFQDEHNDLVIPALFVGKLPEWATHTHLFELAVSGGDITLVGTPTKSILTDAKQDTTDGGEDVQKSDVNSAKTDGGEDVQKSDVNSAKTDANQNAKVADAKGAAK